MRIIRHIIFIPIIFIIVSILFELLPLALIGLMNMSNFWLFVLLIFFGGFAVAIFTLLPGGIAWLTAKITPNKQFAFYSILTISILLCIANIISYWSNPELGQSGFGNFFSILLTCLAIGFTSSISVGAGIEMFEEKEETMSTIMLIGTIVFYLGIFLLFCLLTTKISYINPEKRYSWYSGIWHGIFVIPHWILSWFADGIYCKAPLATVGYKIWWWISFIFFGLSILGGGGSRQRH